MSANLKSSQVSKGLEEPDRRKRTLRLNSIVTEIPSYPRVLVNNKYTVQRKSTQQVVEHPLDHRDSIKKVSSSSSISLPGSRRSSEIPSIIRRSTSHDEELTRSRLKDLNNEDVESLHDQWYNENNYSISEFESSFYWFAMHRKKFGFRYIVLCFIALLYTLFGATVFYFIEGTNEKHVLKIQEKNLDRELSLLAHTLSNMVNDPNKTITIDLMKDFIKKAYIDLQKEESQYKWSVFYRLEDPENNLKWSFGSAFFFSMNVYTTTGYGSISAETQAGQFFTMVYAFVFVPLTLVILRDLGQMFLVNFTKLYAHSLTIVRKLRGHDEVDEDEMIQLPIKYCMSILAIYLLFCTTTVYLYDAIMGPAWSDGLQYFTAFYFSFISLTTIGLGDVMPNNVPYAPPISIIFFLGMAVIKVVNRTTYIAVENGVFGCMTMAENKLDQLLAPVEDTKPINANFGNARDSISDTESDIEEARRNELINNFTVRSIATFMQSNRDVYAGGFGRVALRRGDLMHGSNQNTINSLHNYRHTVHAFNRLKK